MKKKLPRKLKKKLIARFGREAVKKIISGEVIYKAKLTTEITDRGLKIQYGGKTLFMKIK